MKTIHIENGRSATKHAERDIRTFLAASPPLPVKGVQLLTQWMDEKWNEPYIRFSAYILNSSWHKCCFVLLYHFTHIIAELFKRPLAGYVPLIIENHTSFLEQCGGLGYQPEKSVYIILRQVHMGHIPENCRYLLIPYLKHGTDLELSCQLCAVGISLSTLLSAILAAGISAQWILAAMMKKAAVHCCLSDNEIAQAAASYYQLPEGHFFCWNKHGLSPLFRKQKLERLP